MGKTVAIGVQDFGQLREYDNFYVDKTYFIKDWWENRDADREGIEGILTWANDNPDRER